MRTEFLSRTAASSTYRMHRKRWSRQAAWALTEARLATHPIKRLAAALTLAKFGIPKNGVWKP